MILRSLSSPYGGTSKYDDSIDKMTCWLQLGTAAPIALWYGVFVTRNWTLGWSVDDFLNAEGISDQGWARIPTTKLANLLYFPETT